MSAAATISAAAAVGVGKVGGVSGGSSMVDQGSALNCDGNLIPLVLFLFIAGTFLFSSLKTGVETTRVVVRFARDGCNGHKRKNVIKHLKEQERIRFVFGLSHNWFSSIGRLTRRGTSGLSTIKSSGLKRVKSIVGGNNKKTSQVKKVQKKQLNNKKQSQQISFFVFFIRDCIPYRFLSFLWGCLTHLKLPFYWLKFIIYKGWSVMYNCKEDEMRYPFEHYSSLSEFFLRPLKDNVRQVDCKSTHTLCCPVDGKVLHIGSTEITDEIISNLTNNNQRPVVMIDQIKGVSYNLMEFIGSNPSGFENLQSGKKLQSIVLYLAPGDYHHFHSPAEITVKQRRHFPGNLLPVRPWAVKAVEGLYCTNERVVLNGVWEQGYFGYGAVGALNVGSININFDSEVITNQESSRPFSVPKTKCYEKNYETPIQLSRGNVVGNFNLGSTVVLVFETEKDFEFKVSNGQTVQVGQTLGCNTLTAIEKPKVLCPPWPEIPANNF